MINKSDSNNWIIITNPKSGRRTFSKRFDTFIDFLKKNNINYIVKETNYFGHAIEISKECVENNFTNFIIYGGDGTINEVINGIFKNEKNINPKDITIAIIPGGTGNDWARFWKLKKYDNKSFDVFLKGKKQLIDIGLLEVLQGNNTSKHYFINSVGFGLDSMVEKITQSYKKKIGNFSFLYILALFHTLIVAKCRNSKITIDGKEIKTPLYNMNIGNGSYNGGGFKQNPAAVPFDGIFDMIIVGKITFIDVIKILPKAFNGNIYKIKVIKAFKGKNIDIVIEKKNNEVIFAETDGILINNVENCKVSINPNSINMIVP